MNRPGWEAQKPIPICYNCYAHGHFSVDCRKSIGHFAEIISNYESLNVNDKARVPDKNYHLACQLTKPVPDAQPDDRSTLPADVTTPSNSAYSPKN